MKVICISEKRRIKPTSLIFFLFCYLAPVCFSLMRLVHRCIELGVKHCSFTFIYYMADLYKYIRRFFNALFIFNLK